MPESTTSSNAPITHRATGSKKGNDTAYFDTKNPIIIQVNKSACDIATENVTEYQELQRVSFQEVIDNHDKHEIQLT
jgi:hypothetical protein